SANCPGPGHQAVHLPVGEPLAKNLRTCSAANQPVRRQAAPQKNVAVSRGVQRHPLANGLVSGPDWSERAGKRIHGPAVTHVAVASLETRDLPGVGPAPRGSTTSTHR